MSPEGLAGDLQRLDGFKLLVTLGLVILLLGVANQAWDPLTAAVATPGAGLRAGSTAEKLGGTQGAEEVSALIPNAASAPAFQAVSPMVFGSKEIAAPHPPRPLQTQALVLVASPKKTPPTRETAVAASHETAGTQSSVADDLPEGSEPGDQADPTPPSTPGETARPEQAQQTQAGSVASPQEGEKTASFDWSRSFQLLEMARRAARSGRIQEAIEGFRASADAHPENFIALEELGSLYLYALGDTGEAVGAYSEAAVRVAQLGYYGRAAQLLEFIARLDPQRALELRKRLFQG